MKGTVRRPAFESEPGEVDFEVVRGTKQTGRWVNGSRKPSEFLSYRPQGAGKGKAETDGCFQNIVSHSLLFFTLDLVLDESVHDKVMGSCQEDAIQNQQNIVPPQNRKKERKDKGKPNLARDTQRVRIKRRQSVIDEDADHVRDSAVER